MYSPQRTPDELLNRNFDAIAAEFRRVNASASSASTLAAAASAFNLSAGTTSNKLSNAVFSNSNGVSFGLNGSTVTATVRTDYQSAGAYLTTAMQSNRGSDFVQATAAFAGTNASGTIASNGISVSVAPPTGQTLSDFEPYSWYENTGTSTGSLSQLHLIPLTIPQNLTFNNINFIGSGSVATRSAGNTFQFRLTNVQSIGYSAVYSVTNINHVDMFLFSRGTGGFSSELETIASTRNSYITQFFMTFGASVNHTAGSTGSRTCAQTISFTL